MKDKTSSASHAPNFSHYKVTLTDDTTNRIDAMLRSIPFTMGFWPKSWCHADNVMILKRSGVHDIDGMRCIQLFDAEFNIASKKMVKEVMKKAEENSLIAEAQSGNRKRRKANMLLLNKVLLMDLFRQKKQSGAISMNDLFRCFDRIGHTLAILVLICFVLAHKAAKVLFEVL